MAINRALKQYVTKSLLEFAQVQESEKNCIFISHKSEDLKQATAVGDYILQHGDIDIYLDKYDEGLQGAVSKNDHTSIVKYIEQGLIKSTHLLCLVSDMTEISWWVPYEIGFAKRSKINIASLKLKNIDKIPSFLHIEKTIMGTKSLNEYIREIKSKNTSYMYYNDRLISNNASPHPLDSILDWRI